MKTTALVLLIGASAAIAVSLVSISTTRHPDPVEPEKRRGWLARKISRHPRLAAFVRRRLDRTRAGGLLLTLGFVVVMLMATLIGAVFDMVVGEFGFARFDAAVAEYGLNHADSATFEVYALFTRLGGTRVVATVALIVGIWGWWRYRNFQVAMYMLAVTAGQALISNGLKWIVERDRPDLAQLAPWAGSSFPSGHAAAAAATYAAVAFVLTMHSGPRAKVAAAAGAAFVATGVAATRALLGVHWLTDVVAGLAVGFAWFVVVTMSFGGRLMQFGEPRDEVRAPISREGVVNG